MGDRITRQIISESTQLCPKCWGDEFKQKIGTFKWVCGCGTIFNKKCPCYFVKHLCKGCKYFAVCQEHSPSFWETKSIIND